MMTRTARPATGSRRALLHVALLLAFVFIVQQVVTNAPHNPMAMVDSALSARSHPPSCDGMCASAIIHLCLPARRVCAAIVATFTHAPMLTLLVLALIALFAVAAPSWSRIGVLSSWLWPPERRRALLQVFLI